MPPRGVAKGFISGEVPEAAVAVGGGQPGARGQGGCKRGRDGGRGRVVVAMLALSERESLMLSEAGAAANTSVGK